MSVPLFFYAIIYKNKEKMLPICYLKVYFKNNKCSQTLIFTKKSSRHTLICRLSGGSVEYKSTLRSWTIISIISNYLSCTLIITENKILVNSIL